MSAQFSGINGKQNLALLTVIGKDKPGIIAKVTGFLFRHRCNLEDVSMTVLEGELAMFLMVRIPAQTFSNLQSELVKLERSQKLTFFLKSFPRSLMPKKRAQGARLEKFIVSAIGLDKTGIVFHLSQILAKFRLNITDLNSKILSYANKQVYALALEVDIPQNFKILRLEQALAGLRRRLCLDISLRRMENVEF